MCQCSNIPETHGERGSCQKMLQIMECEFKDLNDFQSPCMSVDDKRALKIMEESIIQMRTDCQMALP